LFFLRTTFLDQNPGLLKFREKCAALTVKLELFEGVFFVLGIYIISTAALAPCVLLLILATIIIIESTMKLNSAGGISILELGIYFPALIVSILVCKRHGFGKTSGWLFTLILCVVRIVGACCQLATYHTETIGLLEAVVILESIGISPLLLATLGLLSRW